MSLKQFVRFTNDASAIEKTLRLLQGLAQIFAAYATSSQMVGVWLLSRRQFALGRRFIRFFRWVGCFERAWEGLALGENGEMGGLERMLVVGKWGFMGLFLGCESAGILDVMGLYPSDFAKMLLIEGNKFWFYSLLFSLTLGLLQLFSMPNSNLSVHAGKEEKVTGKEVEKKQAASARVEKTKVTRRGIQRKLLADACDLLVPGFVLGWIGVGSAVSAGSGCVSSLISMGDIWEGLR